MKINFDSTLKTLSGEDIKTEDKPVAMKTVVVDSLLAFTEERLTGEEKLARYNLAQKINVGGDIDLTVEEIAKIKKTVGETRPTLIVGQMFNHIENSTVKKDTKA